MALRTPSRWLAVFNSLLDSALREHGAAALRAELVKPDHDMLRSRLNSLIGNAVEPPTSQLRPFSVANRQILKDGSVWKATGCNMRRAAIYPDHILKAQLDGTKSAGMSIVRFYVSHQDIAAKDMIPKVKNVLDELQKRNLYGLLVLTDAAYSGFNVRDAQENRNSIGANNDRYTWKFYESGFRNAYQQYVIELLKAVGSHPAIFAIDIINECFVPSHPITKAQADTMVNFFSEMAATIREYSPSKLISTGNIAFWEVLVNYAYANNGEYSRKIIRDPNINISTWHSYLVNNQPLGAAYMNIEQEMALFANEQSVAWGMAETATRWEDESDHWFKELVKKLFPFASFLLLWNTNFVYEVDTGDADGYFNAGSKNAAQARRWYNVIGWIKAFADQLALNY